MLQQITIRKTFKLQMRSYSYSSRYGRDEIASWERKRHVDLRESRHVTKHHIVIAGADKNPGEMWFVTRLHFLASGSLV